MVCLFALAVVGLSIPTRPVGNAWTECQGNLVQQSNDHGQRYPSSLQQLDPFYLPSLPTCQYSCFSTMPWTYGSSGDSGSNVTRPSSTGQSAIGESGYGGEVTGLEG
jgi:hypothetical protein